MKSLKKNVLVFLMLSILTVNANANSSTFFNDDAKKTTLKLNNVKSGQKLVMKDLNGTVIYQESIAHNGSYNRSFDLKGLATGEYVFELDQDFAILIIPFNVVDSTVVFNAEKERLFIKPVISNKGNQLKVGKSSLSTSPIKVRIYYESIEDEIIYTDELSSSKIGNRTYTLLENMSGDYRVVCETEGRTFIKHFKI